MASRKTTTAVALWEEEEKEEDCLQQEVVQTIRTTTTRRGRRMPRSFPPQLSSPRGEGSSCSSSSSSWRQQQQRKKSNFSARVISIIMILSAAAGRRVSGWFVSNRKSSSMPFSRLQGRRSLLVPSMNSQTIRQRRRQGPSSSFFTTTTTSLDSTAVWQEGDAVVVVKQGEGGGGGESKQQNHEYSTETSSNDSDSRKSTANTLLGVVQENRGRGWYSVQMMDTGETIKCRSTQLQRPTDDKKQDDDAVLAVTQNNNNNNNTSLTSVSTTKAAALTNDTVTHRAISTFAADAFEQHEAGTDEEAIPVVAAPPPPTVIDLDAAVEQARISSRSSSSSSMISKDGPGTTLSSSIEDGVELPTDQAYLEQVAHHLSYSNKWVVFTDLHCAPSTLDTCLEVLQTVHDLAVERQAGILFLGDFWHHRGTLRVDCLNAVLHHFKSTWTVPMVLIPGNHDQVTLGGHNHGLTPLENAYRVVVKGNKNSNNISDITTTTTLPGPLIFSHPTKFANALFVPHIRDNAVMESVLQSDLAHDASAIFVHADVRGAFMNDLIVSLHGVPTYMFPRDKHIYSGHFHKPHVVNKDKVRIEYFGSPFEISLAEAQQQKALCVLDSSQDWKVVERIPIHLGRKHFKPMSVDDFCALQPVTATVSGAGNRPVNTTSSSSSNESQATTDVPTLIQPGDRIVFSIQMDRLEEIRRAAKKAGNSSNVVDEHAQQLRKAGVSVEIREVKDLPLEPLGNTTDQQARELEEMSLESTWRAFLKEQVLRDVYSNATAEELLDAGLEALGELETDDKLQPRPSDHVTNLELKSMTVEGFGPFRDRLTYPLKNRGLVLLRGVNKDGGSDSNGSGKSSLAMAALWALTGTVDPRPLEDSKVSDVVNDLSKAARVSVTGSLNGVDFVITRSKTVKKSGGLTFFLDGEDMSTQTAKETQALIDESLGVSPSILARTMFHGQHSLNELLEATDSKLKDEMSLVVPLATWQAAVTASRKKMRDADKRAAELQGMISIRSGDHELIQRRLVRAEDGLEMAKEHFDRINADLQASLADLSGDRDGDGQLIEDFEELEKSMMEASQQAADVELEIKSLVGERDKNVLHSQEEVDYASSSLAAATADLQSAQRQVDKAKFRYDATKERIDALGETWGVEFDSDFQSSLSLPATCPTCRQPISEDVAGHDHSAIKDSIEQDVQKALSALNEAEMACKSADDCLRSAEQRERESTAQVNAAQTILDKGVTAWNKSLGELEKKLANARARKEEKSALLSTRAKLVERQSKIELLEASIRKEESNLERAQSTADAVRVEYSDCEKLLDQLRSQQDEEMTTSKMLKSLADALGQRGVQTFVLQNAVSSLQTAAQLFLDDLSDGSQRLQLSLDSGDRISRSALIRGADGCYSERPLATLSGGQWRRCSLALQLGFADWVARRGKLRPSLCVLDEPLTHLDRSGRTEVGRVLRNLVHQSGTSSSSGLQVSTMLLILQDLAAEELEEAFDCIDDVIKKDGCSSVHVDDEHEEKI